MGNLFLGKKEQEEEVVLLLPPHLHHVDLQVYMDKMGQTSLVHEDASAPGVTGVLIVTDPY